MMAIESPHRIVVIDEARLLKGREEEFRAADHQKKNWMLRSGLVELEEVDDIFLMLDDDNLPLAEVGVHDFIAPDGSFNAYYFHDLIRWSYRVSEFDEGQRATAAALDQAGFEMLSYASHQPQVIDKVLFAEAVAWAGREAGRSNICEWSIYFNYAVTSYPTLFHKRVFRTLNWPGRASDWAHQYSPSTYRFENFYSKSYSIGLFEGLTADTDAEHKTTRKEVEVAAYQRSQRLFAASRELISRDGLVHGALRFESEDLQVLVSGLPQLITAAARSVVRFDIAFQVRGKDAAKHEIAICYRVLNRYARGVRIRRDDEEPVPYEAGAASLPFLARKAGVYDVEYFLRVDGTAHHPEGARYLAKLVVVGPDERPAKGYRAIVAQLSPQPVLRRRRARNLAKRVAFRAVPGLRGERERFHEMSRRLENVERTVGPLPAIGRTSDERLVRVEARLSELTKRIEKTAAAAAGAPSLRALHNRIKATSVDAPVYGLTGLGTEAPRETVARARFMEDDLGRVVGKRVLVVGSAFGYLPMYFAERGAKAIGWETRVASVEISRRAADAVGSAATFASPDDMMVAISAIDPSYFDIAIIDPVLDPVAEDTQRWIEALSARVPIVIHDGAAGEQVQASADGSLRVLGHFPWRTESARRPLVVRRQPQTVSVNGHEYPYLRSTSEAYEGSPMARQNRFRRYYFSPLHVVKEYHFDEMAEQELRQPLREINLFVNTLAGAAIWHPVTLVDFEVLEGRVRLVYQTVPGTLLREAAPLDAFASTGVARDVVQTLCDLDALGISHNDVRSWNVIVSEEGAWLIDYGLAGAEATEDNAAALLWTLHTTITGQPEGFATGKDGLPERAPFVDTPLEALFDLVAAGERSWPVLRDSIPTDAH
jgi:tRNA A-37 threonylcarbamoyl transferase component Bud32